MVEVLEVKGESRIKGGFTSREPSAVENTDYFYTAVSLAESVKPGDIISLYASRTGEVRSNRDGGVPTTLLFVDPGNRTFWLFLELEGRIAVRALTTTDLHVKGETLPSLWESTKRTVRNGDQQEDAEEVIPIDHPLPASPPPPITEEQVCTLLLHFPFRNPYIIYK
jgi:hypothetical protein